MKGPIKKPLIVATLVVFMSMSAQASIWSWLLGVSEPTTYEQNQASTSQGVSYEQYQSPTLTITTHQYPLGEDTTEAHSHAHDDYAPTIAGDVGTQVHYQNWLTAHPSYQAQIDEYQQYLNHYLGGHVPPMHELLTTARSWQACGYEPYQVPPQELWVNMIATLKLYHTLKSRGILPMHTQIRSVYRSPALNECAGGATGSKHLLNSAIDIWVPDYGDESVELYDLKDKLCQFWRDEGATYQFGLGLYSTGAIHIDTQKYRKWGGQFSRATSACHEPVVSPMSF